MSDKPRIRRARAAEADRLKAIGVTGWETTYANFVEKTNREHYLASYFWSVDRLCAVIEDERSQTLVAEYRDAVVGFITIEPVDSETAELTRLYVDPEHRGSGLGQTLWEAALPPLRSTDVRAVLVNVFGDNWAGRRFYERLGFVLTEETTTAVGTQTVYDVWYRLEL